ATALLLRMSELSLLIQAGSPARLVKMATTEVTEAARVAEAVGSSQGPPATEARALLAEVSRLAGETTAGIAARLAAMDDAMGALGYRHYDAGAKAHSVAPVPAGSHRA
ncbi:MAG: hypothetical protein ACRD0J_13905, partial [Acidimicrobiales bacterium]